MKAVRAALLALAMILLAYLPALADGTPTPAVPQEKVQAVARTLWSPILGGGRLDKCELKVCEQMRQDIARKLAAGETPEQIRQEFVSLYGPQVLGEPPKRGINLLVWVLPAVGLLLGAVWLYFAMRRWREPEPLAPTISLEDEELREYLKQVEEDLDKMRE
jgi:cytochrome c-type biogenesis protein CcmH